MLLNRNFELVAKAVSLNPHATVMSFRYAAKRHSELFLLWKIDPRTRETPRCVRARQPPETRLTPRHILGDNPGSSKVRSSRFDRCHS
jgi:hypothetical protein